jgi:translation initiation factor IF-1
VTDESEESRTSKDPEQAGTVDEVLPKSMYRVRLSDGTLVRAGIDAPWRHGIVRLLLVDTVLVRLYPNDPTRAQITKKR